MTGTGTSRALARTTTTTPPLTTADQAAIARFGRPSLLRRLRIQVTAAWSATASTLIVGFPMMMSEDLTVSDTGVIVTMMSLPAMILAAHGQSRLTRVRANDPAAPRPLPVNGAVRPEAAEVGELTDLRGRLAELVTAIEPHFPDVAAAMRSADSIAHEQLQQQIRALSMLGESEDDVTVQARAEIRQRLGAGFAEYRTLIAEAALLLARRDSHLAAAEPLRAAAELAATYSEGIRVSERSGGR